VQLGQLIDGIQDSQYIIDSSFRHYRLKPILRTWVQDLGEILAGSLGGARGQPRVANFEMKIFEKICFQM
jgi:hypothetical protein